MKTLNHSLSEIHFLCVMPYQKGTPTVTLTPRKASAKTTAFHINAIISRRSCKLSISPLAVLILVSSSSSLLLLNFLLRATVRHHHHLPRQMRNPKRKTMKNLQVSLRFIFRLSDVSPADEGWRGCGGEKIIYRPFRRWTILPHKNISLADYGRRSLLSAKNVLRKHREICALNENIYQNKPGRLKTNRATQSSPTNRTRNS